mmetsp:Transcript_90351/g.269570  ORF Transcript_90351/g.269570 Transcript_90351/m.269570 type:complete len:203 (-) Transcript_90351:1287-1895(-)
MRRPRSWCASAPQQERSLYKRATQKVDAKWRVSWDRNARASCWPSRDAFHQTRSTQACMHAAGSVLPRPGRQRGHPSEAGIAEQRATLGPRAAREDLDHGPVPRHLHEVRPEQGLPAADHDHPPRADEPRLHAAHEARRVPVRLLHGVEVQRLEDLVLDGGLAHADVPGAVDLRQLRRGAPAHRPLHDETAQRPACRVRAQD